MHQNSPTVVKNLLFEFYLYNYDVSSDNEWNPLLYIGDNQLKALISWMQNEIGMGTHARMHKNLEFDYPLPFRAEAKNPWHMYYDWQNLLT